MPDNDKNLNNGGSGQGAAGAEDKNQQNKNNANGGSNDRAGASDGGNNAGGTDNGQDQGGKKDDKAGASDETVTIKKSDWEKTNKDLDNYRTGLINKKTNDRSLESDAGSSGANNNDSSSTLDEKKVEEIAIRASQATTHKTNEKAGIKTFLKSHGDYVDDKNWQELLAYLPANVNKDDPNGIIDALEGAVLLHKRATGQLDQYLDDQRAAAKRDAEMNAQVNLGFGSGGLGSKTNQDNKTDKVAESTIEMGKHFGHDSTKIEETLKSTPKSPEGVYEIDVTQKRKK